MAARVDAQGWTVQPGSSIRVSGISFAELTEVCKLVPCPSIPYGEEEKVAGVSFFMPVNEALKATAGVFFFRPGDWSLRLAAPTAPGPPFPVDLTDFHEEHAELGSGLIGDVDGEGVNLFFPVPPHVWESAQAIQLDLILTNLTQSAYTFNRLGRDSLPLFRLCLRPDDRRGDGFERRFYPVTDRDDHFNYYYMIGGDREGDGDVDLFLHHSEEDEILTLINEGRHRFTISRDTHPEIEVSRNHFGGGDLDLDGDFDLVLSNWLGDEEGNIVVFPGLGEWGFGGARIYRGFPSVAPDIFTLADVNADGELDLLSLFDYESYGIDTHEIGVFLGNGSGGFQAGRIVSTGLNRPFTAPDVLAAADFSGDGRVDIATFDVLASTDSLAILIGDGRGGFAPSPRRSDTGVDESQGYVDTGVSILTGDFDGDGDEDLAIGMRDHVSVLINRGDATFLAPRLLETRQWVRNLQAPDLDLDGDQDLAVSCWADPAIMLFLNDGRGRFTSGGEIPAEELTADLVAADLDGDGDEDLALSEVSGVSVWENLEIAPPRLGDPRLDIIAQAVPSGTSGLSPALFDGQTGEISVLVPPGNRGSATFYIALVSKLALAGTGIQGWSLLASVTDDLEITDVTTSGTAAGGAQYQVAQAGELITPGTGLSRGPGIRSEVFLAFRDNSETLPPEGTATVLEVTVRTRDVLRPGDQVRGRVTWQDDYLFRQAGSDVPRGPYRNRATVAGHGLLFCECPGLDITFRTFGTLAEAVAPREVLEAAGIQGNLLPRLCDRIICPQPLLGGAPVPASMEGFSLLLPFGAHLLEESRRNLVFRPGDWALELSDPDEPAPDEPLLELTDFHEEHIELGSQILGDQPGEGVNLFFPVDPRTWSAIADRSLMLRIRNLTAGKPNESSYWIDRVYRGGLPVTQLCAIQDGESRLDAIIQKEPSAPGGLSAILNDGEVKDIFVSVPPGEVGEWTFHVALVSQLPLEGPGIQAWRLVARMMGDLELVSVTADGTAAADAEHVFAAPGELRDVTTGEVIGAGFMAETTLGASGTLPPVGTATVFRVTVRTRGPVDLGERVGGRVDWIDGARLEHALGLGNGYDNVITVYSGSHRLCTCRGASIIFEGRPPGRFRRADANGDGGVDISDAVRVLEFLFAGGAAPDCPDAADSDDDAKMDISDAVRTLNFLFLGAASPPAPGPFECGGDPTNDELAPCSQASCP